MSASNNTRPTSDKSQIQMLNASTLRRHPRQAELVGKMRRGEVDALAIRIAIHGIQSPLTVMADERTVVVGYPNLRAARVLGIETVPCVVRSDLQDLQDPKVLELLVSNGHSGVVTQAPQE